MKGKHKYSHTNRGQNGHFPSSFQSGWNNNDRIPQKNTGIQGLFADFWGPCPVHPMSSHTWGDCFNNPKNKASEGQNSNPHSMETHSGHGYHYSTRGQGRGFGCGHGSYNVPCLTNPFPTLYIQQVPTNVPTDAISIVTNTDTSSVVPTPTYVVKHVNNNRGEKNSQRLYGNVVHCKAVYIDDIHCCETAAEAKNVANLELPCANSHTHHFNSYFYPQDGVINGHQPDKNHTFYVFDTECIQEVDNFQI